MATELCGVNHGRLLLEHGETFAFGVVGTCQHVCFCFCWNMPTCLLWVLLEHANMFAFGVVLLWQILLGVVYAVVVISTVEYRVFVLGSLLAHKLRRIYVYI